MGHDIYQATDFQVLPIDNNSQAREHPAERHLIALIHAHLAGGMFWFSYTWDITRRLQAHAVSAGADAGRALWETVWTFPRHFLPVCSPLSPGRRPFLLEQVSRAEQSTTSD